MSIYRIRRSTCFELPNCEHRVHSSSFGEIGSVCRNGDCTVFCAKETNTYNIIYRRGLTSIL